MDIALLLGEVAFVSHQKMINGILDLALKENTNVFLFTCEGWRYQEKTGYEQGEYSIFELPDFSRFDGVIFDIDTIQDEKTRDIIISKVRASHIPCVSINIDLGLSNVSVIQLENQTGIISMVEHLHNVHGAKEIGYISGPMHNRDAVERKEVFEKTMEKMGLTCRKELIFYGDYGYKSGKAAIKNYLKTGQALPDALMSANDDMAIGALNALQAEGYRVPEDIIVTGYDDCKMASYVEPNLTTIIRGEYEAGELAYRTIMQGIKGEICEKRTVIYGKPVFAGSCGCNNCRGDIKKSLIELTKSQIYMDNNLELLKSTAIEFANMNTFMDFSECIKKYVENMELEYFYLCLCGSDEVYREEMEQLSAGKEVERDRTRYTDEVWIPLAYEKGEWNSYQGFNRELLLSPERKKETEGTYYIVMPVHHESVCIGYCVVGNYKDVLEGNFIQHLVLNIDNAIGNIRKQDLMQVMLERINQKWIYDELTGIYNRSGLWKYSEQLIEKAKKEQLSVAVIFSDLNHLKLVNDRYGHEAGDFYIKSMAFVLKQCSKENDLLVRYGGDEYLVVTMVNQEDEARQYVDNIKKQIQSLNQSRTQYKLSASIGYTVESDVSQIDLKKVIELADQEMYKEKKKWRDEEKRSE